jgi:hypothetical protein
LQAPSNRILLIEKCVVTKVGLQFWNQGRAAVLYQWNAVPKATESTHVMETHESAQLN